MWIAQACGDVPIDTTDVVAGLVGADIARFGSVARGETPVIALEKPVETSGDAELKATQHLSGRRANDARGSGGALAHRLRIAVGSCEGATTGA